MVKCHPETWTKWKLPSNITKQEGETLSSPLLQDFHGSSCSAHFRSWDGISLGIQSWYKPDCPHLGSRPQCSESSMLELELGVPQDEDVTMQPDIWPACQAEPYFLIRSVPRSLRAQDTAWLCDLCGTRWPPGTEQCIHRLGPTWRKEVESRPERPSQQMQLVGALSAW